MEWLKGLIMCILLFFLLGWVGSCPDNCICSPVADSGQWVYCAILEEKPFPVFPGNTIMLDLQGNHLHGIPAGALDHLSDLRRLWMKGNSFECGCKILYLKHWLEDHRNQVVTYGGYCTLPNGILKSIDSLTGNEYTSCEGIPEPRCLVHIRWGVATLCLTLLSVFFLTYIVVIARRILNKQ